ncbi:hypothetical protein WR25_17131 [Diploscapter pachys]|uniref:Cytochrome P450 n=1 Tax=Diploscapter pachys TaxID=2018661 RepID=A0A2A2JGT0_9BILA|nr:hypothetical protein WR25_17131 [Diploscapter pachys]
MREELDKQIGGDRMVIMDDKPQLVYINAVINETQRLANVLVHNFPRMNNVDVDINGYHIPARTIIVPQISTVMYDEKIFPEPYKFKPERHLNPDSSLRKIEEAKFEIEKSL